MSPTSFHNNDHHAKPCTNINIGNTNNNNCNNGSLLPPCLKVNKESHISKHVSPPPPAQFSLPSPPSSSSSSSPPSKMGTVKPAPQQQQQMRHHPVIIYTHSPKIIHTHPKDFMALVQKLTGLSQAEDDGRLPPPTNHKQEKPSAKESTKEEKINKVNDDNEYSSVITEENSRNSNNNHNNNNNNNMLGDGQVNSCFVPSMFDPPNPYMTNIPVFAPNSSSADFLCTNHHQPFFGYTNSLLFGTPNNLSIPTTSTLEGISDFREF